jgi:hypothetical protein
MSFPTSPSLATSSPWLGPVISLYVAMRIAQYVRERGKREGIPANPARTTCTAPVTCFSPAFLSLCLSEMTQAEERQIRPSVMTLVSRWKAAWTARAQRLSSNPLPRRRRADESSSSDESDDVLWPLESGAQGPAASWAEDPFQASMQERWLLCRVEHRAGRKVDAHLQMVDSLSHAPLPHTAADPPHSLRGGKCYCKSCRERLVTLPMSCESVGKASFRWDSPP